MSSSTALAPLVPAVRGACGRAWKAFASISSVHARQASGSHLFRIDGYSAINAMVPVDKFIDSGKFHAGGSRWKLLFYPNGMRKYSWEKNYTKKPTVSVQLLLQEDSQVMATYKVSILDRAGMPAYSAAAKPCLYRQYKSWKTNETGLANLVSVQELRESADRVVDQDDCLNVLCEVSVLKLDSESVGMWYVRQALGILR